MDFWTFFIYFVLASFLLAFIGPVISILIMLIISLPVMIFEKVKNTFKGEEK